jgi:hypothetical protein
MPPYNHALVFWQAWGKSYDMALTFLQNGDPRYAEKMTAGDWRNPICGAQQLEVMATVSERLLLDDTIVCAASGKANWCQAEILRAQGEAVLNNNTADAAAAAELLFQQSLDIARRQQARSWDLRSATSLARLWRVQHRTAEAGELLSGVYGRFSEGLNSADLITARQLLNELS